MLNNYALGYMAIPVILACKKYGLFNILNTTQPCPFIVLVQKLQANSGHLRTSLQLLESLNWVYRDNRNEYLLAHEADIHHKIPEDIINLLSFPMTEYFKKNQKKHRLKKWIELSGRRWDIDNPTMANYLDGMLVVPLLLALNESKLLGDLSRLRPAASEELKEFFHSQGWLSQEKEDTLFNATGLFMMENIHRLEEVALYKPLLSNISELIFGDCKSVFEKYPFDCTIGAEHTWEILNNRFPEDKGSAHLEELILAIFNRKPYSEQPRYIADMGCGQGKLLKNIYEIIKHKSLRGKVLDDYPLKLIGIGFNEKALAETAKTLQDMDHMVLKGDMGHPEQIIADLKGSGIQDVENILYISSFLSRPRSYIPPVNEAAAAERANISCGIVCVDSEGKEISTALAIQSLVEYFQRWAAVIGKHGLISLEEHEGTDLRFNACSSFYHRLSAEGDKFIIAAAEAGLFPNQEFFRKYPLKQPFTQITLNYFEKRDYIIRLARENDLAALTQLEKECWQPELQRPVPALQRRLKVYPQGQLVLELDNQVVGAIYSQRILSADDLSKTTMEDVETLHNKNRNIVHLLAINILNKIQHRNLGDQLLEFMLEYCTLMNGIEKIAAVTRCKDYPKHSDVAYEEYIKLKNEQGRYVDTILRFHDLHGAQIKGVIPNYRPKDEENKGYGVLVEYDIFNRRRNTFQVHNGGPLKEDENKAANQNSVKEFIGAAISSVLGKTQEKEVDLEQPLMEMGLNSADLLELHEQISYKYQIALEPAFFFKYNTAEKIISYLQEHVEFEEAESAVKIAENRTALPIEHQEDTESTAEIGGQEIAIIGVACRFPGGINNKEQLWELLIGNKDAVRKMPQQRWKWPKNIDPDNEHQGIDFGGFLDEIANFDASFFRISPKEAELMDPQQRILLELSWLCLEDGGYSAQKLSGSKTGVFIGASGSDYNRYLDRHQEEIDAHYGVGVSMAVLPNRISYFYDFCGPSLLIDTACSSSLVAVHEAVKSLQEGECKLALAGGINIMCYPSTSIAYYKAGMLAEDGKCKTFDKSANGYVRAEGAGLVLLKPLKQALRDNDSILAVVKGTAVNHGGKASGLTVPNPGKQASVIADAFNKAGFEPETVSYIEAHGTGTSLGDPIEISGLKEAFARLDKTSQEVQNHYCGLGSIKTNLGHLEAAAGIAGFLKVVLSMQHQILPASLHFNELNPHISLFQTPFYIVNKNQSWQLSQNQHVRRAGISSFGSGGVNAHVALEEAPVIPQNTNREFPCYLICLSAKTEKALRQKEQDLAYWLENEGQEKDIAAISATLLMGREHFAIRSACVVKDSQELQQKLKEVLEKGEAEGYFRDGTKRKKQMQPLFEKLGETLIKELNKAEKIAEGEYGHQLMALAELFVQGYELDWNAVYAGQGIKRLSLPTYPFSRELYWVQESKTQPVISLAADARLTGTTKSDKEPGKISLRLLSPESSAVNPVQTANKADLLQRELAASLAEALHVEAGDMDIDTKFIELGMDSIIGVQWVRAINQKYKTSISATKVYDYPNIREFTAFLEKELYKTKCTISLNEVLQQVHSGVLDIEEADELLNKISI